MAKWFGKVGYCGSFESEPGYWMEQCIEREYFGDIVRANPGFTEQQHSTVDDLTLNAQISIVADPFAHQNAAMIKWVEFLGGRWKVKSLEINYPRLVLTLGGVWNG